MHAPAIRIVRASAWSAEAFSSWGAGGFSFDPRAVERQPENRIPDIRCEAMPGRDKFPKRHVSADNVQTGVIGINANHFQITTYEASLDGCNSRRLH